MNQKFKHLVKLFQKLPGVGPRQAARFVIALMDKPESELQEFGTALVNLKKDISFCTVCFNISDNVSPVDNRLAKSVIHNLCSICLDKKRDQTKLLVVERVTDLDSIERTGLYKGLYHVLGGAINPLDSLTPDKLKLRELEDRINKISAPVGQDLAKSGAGKIELIIATNLNTAGETTSHYIREAFGSTSWRKKGIFLTRLARGLSSGSNLEYTDEITLKNALDYRK